MHVPKRAPQAVRFGSFVVKLRSGELYRNGTKLRLQEQPFQILAMLLARPGEVVTRDELREELWPDRTFVDFDHGINVAIAKIREALGDCPDEATVCRHCRQARLSILGACRVRTGRNSLITSVKHLPVRSAYKMPLSST